MGAPSERGVIGLEDGRHGHWIQVMLVKVTDDGGASQAFIIFCDLGGGQVAAHRHGTEKVVGMSGAETR